MHKKMCRHQELCNILLLVYVRNGSVLADDDDPSGYARAGMKIAHAFVPLELGTINLRIGTSTLEARPLMKKILSLLNVQALVWRFLCTKNICKTVLNT